MLFSLLKHHLDLNITDTALKVSRSHGVETISPGCGVRASLMLFLLDVLMVSSEFFFSF